MLDNGTVIEGREVIYAVEVGRGTLVLLASGAGYVSAWQAPSFSGDRKELVFPHPRLRWDSAVFNFMARYDGDGGTDYAGVRSALLAAEEAWRKRKAAKS